MVLSTYYPGGYPVAQLHRSADPAALAYTRERATHATAGEIRRTLEQYFLLSDSVAAQSRTGPQLDNLRLGLLSSGGVDIWAVKGSAEALSHKRGLLAKLWQEINPLPRTLLVASMTPIGWERYERKAKEGELLRPFEAAFRFGGLCKQLRKVKKGKPPRICLEPSLPGELTCRAHRSLVAGDEGQLMTDRGEIYTREAEEGYVWVARRRDVTPDNGRLAEALSATHDDAPPYVLETTPTKRGQPTSEEDLLENTASLIRSLLASAGLHLPTLRAEGGPLEATETGEVRPRRVRYILERCFDAVRESSTFAAIYEPREEEG